METYLLIWIKTLNAFTLSLILTLPIDIGFTTLSCDTKTIEHLQFSKRHPPILGIDLFVFDKQILNLLCRVIATDFQDKIGKEMIMLYTYQNGKYTDIQNY